MLLIRSRVFSSSSSLLNLCSPSSSLLLSRTFTSHAGGNITIHHVDSIHSSSNNNNINNNGEIKIDINSKETDLKKYSHLFANPKVKKIIDRIVRVDQAGEFGAARIYDGQLAVLKNNEEGPLIEHMAQQEREHQATFNALIRHFRVRPTILTPFWDVAGFALGALPALGGKPLAMAVTVAVETVISEHYNDQLRELHECNLTEGDYEILRKFIKRFRDEELEHHDIGIQQEAEKAPFYSIFNSTVQAGVKGAIFLSSRF